MVVDYKSPGYRAFGFSLALLSLFWVAPAIAHPHVWVTYQTTVIYDKGAISAFEHVWTFDDMYTAMAIQGLDKNNDGTYDKAELAELAQVNMDGLKDFDYFTFPKLGTSELTLAGPQEPWLEHTNGILRLHFKLPLSQPVLAEAEGFNFSIHDPSYFIAFEPEKTDALKLSASAPEGCKVAFGEAKPDANSEELKAKLLDNAFAQELGQTQDIGAGFSTTASVTCAKS
jgi:ABC-type uncharacterized transport system substrate-binding protein